MGAFRASRLHTDYRPNGGFLTVEQWTSAIEAAGFRGVRVLPDVAHIRDVFPTFFVAAARTWMPGPERPKGCFGPGMTAQGPRGTPNRQKAPSFPCHFIPLGLKARHVRSPRTPGGLLWDANGPRCGL